MNPNNLASQIIEFENGELDANSVLSLFAYLVESGLVWQLQGSYGRAARSLIESGYIDLDGNVLVDAKEIGA